MKVETIKAIFTNVLFVIGVILIIIGFVQGTLTAVRLATFDKYPLEYYEESRCDFDYSLAAPIGTEGTPAVAPADLQERRNRCLSSLDYERKVKQTEDIVTSLTMLVAGVALVLSFRKFIFK